MGQRGRRAQGERSPTRDLSWLRPKSDFLLLRQLSGPTRVCSLEEPEELTAALMFQARGWAPAPGAGPSSTDRTPVSWRRAVGAPPLA